MLRLSDFDYRLPSGLIAQYPLKDRDKAKLLILDHKSGEIAHRIFKDIIEYLRPQDLLVLNDTKVLTSRLIGRRITGGRVEVLLLKRKTGLSFEALIKPARIKLGEEITFNNQKITGRLTARNEMTFSAETIGHVYEQGLMPLPPYIKREPEELDNIHYQTVYAKKEGAIASPTAGLHFTPGLIAKILSSQVKIAYLTLHVGYPTFKPIKTEDLSEHKMEGEYFSIDDETVRLIREARRRQSRIIAVGTTSCRALESYASGAKEGYTDLFIYPGYQFKSLNCLLTNFHLPRTTLFMLVCAFAGAEKIKKAYQEAIDKDYRFYSYGDAMLII